MFGRFTKKSLIVSAALLTAMICTGVVAASAHAVFPDSVRAASSNPQGIPAISPARGKALLSVPAVIRYLHKQGFVGGLTRNGAAPTVQHIQLTDASTLNRLAHIFLPGLPDTAKVYYTRLKGPFVLSPRTSRPVLNTLLPEANNLPALHTLLPDMSHTPGLDKLLSPFPSQSKPAGGLAPGSRTRTGGSQPAMHTSSQRKPTDRKGAGQGKTRQGRKGGPRKPASLGKLPGTHAAGLGTVLQQVYEVFDAHTGNLLAWG